MADTSAPTGARAGLTKAYRGVAALIALGVVVQVFLAGLGIFGAADFRDFGEHEAFGWTLHTLAVVLVLLAIAGPRTRWDIGASIALLVLMTVQIMLVNSADDAPGLAALHPTLALLVLALALWIHLRGRLVRAARA